MNISGQKLRRLEQRKMLEAGGRAVAIAVADHRARCTLVRGTEERGSAAIPAANCSCAPRRIGPLRYPCCLVSVVAQCEWQWHATLSAARTIHQAMSAV